MGRDGRGGDGNREVKGQEVYKGVGEEYVEVKRNRISQLVYNCCNNECGKNNCKRPGNKS